MSLIFPDGLPYDYAALCSMSGAPGRLWRCQVTPPSVTGSEGWCSSTWLSADVAEDEQPPPRQRGRPPWVRSGSRGRPGGAGQHRVPRPAPTFSLHAIITYLSTIRLFIDIFLNLNVTIFIFATCSISCSLNRKKNWMWKYNVSAFSKYITK